MYWLLAHLFGALADLFYRRTKQGAKIPSTGPLLIVANHPNGLVDPLLVIRDAGRRVRFLAKEPLFRMPIIGQLLRWMGALPVYRARDGHDTSKNDETFRAVYDALLSGDAVAIFPEGTSHSDPSMKPLKTGAARMALGAASQTANATSIRVLPLGLVYRNKVSFRSEALTLVGETIAVEPFLERHATDARAAVDELTEAIDLGLRKVTLNLERWEDQPLLELASRVWRPDSEQLLADVGLVADGDRSLREEAPERIARLKGRVEAFALALKAAGLRAEHLDRRYDLTEISGFMFRNLLALSVGLPFALLGALAYFVPYQLVRVLVWAMRPEKDLIATYKVLWSLLLYPVWHTAIVSALVSWVGGWPGFITSLVAPLAGLYALRFISRRQAAGEEVKVFLKGAAFAASKKSLLKERDWIRTEMEALALTHQQRQKG